MSGPVPIERLYKVIDIRGNVSPSITEQQLYEYARTGVIKPQTQIIDELANRPMLAGNHASLAVIFRQTGALASPPAVAPLPVPAASIPIPAAAIPQPLPPIAGPDTRPFKIGGIVLFILALIWFGNCVPSHPTNTGAWVYSTQVVRNCLKSPSTAKFPFMADGGQVKEVGKDRFWIRGYVDSQNGFGAMIRTYWQTIVQGGSDDYHWKLQYLKVDDETILDERPSQSEQREEQE